MVVVTCSTPGLLVHDIQGIQSVEIYQNTDFRTKSI